MWPLFPPPARQDAISGFMSLSFRTTNAPRIGTTKWNLCGSGSTHREGWEISDRLLVAPQGTKPESNEIRQLDFEVKTPSNRSGDTRLNAYALYYVCEDVGGQCVYRRQDVEIRIKIADSE